MQELLTKSGKTLKVDDLDFPYLSLFRWYGEDRYAYRETKGKKVYLHRLLAGALPGQEVDHANGDTLDNRRENLRVCTKSQNGANRKIQRNNKSGYKGVSWSSYYRKWYAQIQVDSHAYNLGRYADVRAAAKAYDDAARLHFGPFAKLNFSS